MDIHFGSFFKHLNADLRNSHNDKLVTVWTSILEEGDLLTCSP